MNNNAREISGYPPILREFASYKLNIQGCSKKTVDEYLLDLRTFTKYILLKNVGADVTYENLENTDISAVDAKFYSEITTLDIYEFLYYVGEERGNESAAKSRKLSSIKSLYKFLTVKRNYFEENPAINIESPKNKRQLPKYLTLDESIKLLESVKSDTESKTRKRDYAIITLFLNCGMRVSELCGISVDDIDDSMKTLRVLGKGSKERMIYLNDACREALKNYLPERIQLAEAAKGETALFLSTHGRNNRISVKTVQWVVYKYLERAGLQYRHLSTHKLRHTAATLMYQTGEVDIRTLKDILGHEQLTTTQIYTHVSDEQMKEAVEKNPLSDIHIAEAVEKSGDTADN